MMMTSGVTRASGVCCNRQTTRRVVTRATANTKEHKVRTANAVSSVRRDGGKEKGRQDKPCVSTSFMFDPSLSRARATDADLSLSLSLSLSVSLFFFFLR